MAELEIHHEGHESDPFGQRVGVMAAIIAVFLAGVTIQSHRSHTDAIIFKTEANDQWAYYQAKSIKRTGYDIARDTAAQRDGAGALSAKFQKESERYKRESEEIQNGAKEKEAECSLAEKKALRYDLGEGLLELGLVLSSLYFISKKKLFPSVGITSAVLGLVIAATALFLH